MKAILILNDMPKGCDYCHYCRWNNTLDGDYCEANIGTLKRIGEGGYYGEGVKPSWCPLKPMPEKFEVRKNTFHGIGEETYEVNENTPFEQGWNACLEEILVEEV